MSREHDDDATEILAGDTQGTTPVASDEDATVLDRTSEVGCPLTRLSAVDDGRQRQEDATPRKRLSPWWGLVAVLALALAALYFLLVGASQPDLQANTDQYDSVYRNSLVLVETSLEADDVGTLVAQLWFMAQAHPQNLELERLLEDATRYELMQQAVQQRRLIELAILRGDRRLATEIFEDAAVVKIDPLLPGPDFVQAMQSARQQWRKGELVDALNQLRALTSAGGSDLAAQWLKRYAEVIASYDALNRLKTAPAYPMALVSFYLTLDPLQDEFFLQQVDADMDAVQSALEQGLVQRLRGSVRHWLSYHSHGGIDDSLRRNLQADPGFQQRALELAGAFNELSAVQALQGAEGLPDALGELPFPVQVKEEISYQRDRLASLLVYNNQPVLETRLTLLPFVDINAGTAP